MNMYYCMGNTKNYCWQCINIFNLNFYEAQLCLINVSIDKHIEMYLLKN